MEGRGGFPGPCPSPLSRQLGHYMADGCIPSLLLGLSAFMSLFLAGPGLNIFPHFANVAQVLQPEPPASSGSLPLHQVHVPLSS